MLLLHLLLDHERRKVTRLGWVADFCPACRSIRPFRIDRHGRDGGHVSTCSGCDAPRDVNPAKYVSFARRAGRDLEALIQATFPRVREVHAEGLRLEETRSKGELTTNDREKLVTQVFFTFERQVLENFRPGQARGPGLWLFMLVCAALVCGAMWIRGGMFDARADRETSFSILYYTCGAGLVLSLFLMFREPGRRFRRRILPALARALDPLEPDWDVLALVLDRLRKSGLKVGRKTRLDVLWTEIARVSAIRRARPVRGVSPLRTC